MQNYKECTDAEFNEAMGMLRLIRNEIVKVEDVKTPQLYIMYTKLNADYAQLSGVGTSYALSLRTKTQQRSDQLKEELIRRKVLSERVT